MSGIPDYDDYDGLGLAELVRSGSVSASELADEALSRVARIDPRLNCVVRTLPVLAAERAREALDGPFQGVPFLVKDLLQSIPGVPTESGSQFWRGWTCDMPTTLYEGWLAAGVVPVGKTTTPELGILPVTESVAEGPTRNPWNPTRTAGGSSGGSGAAVAAGIVPVASGGDGGGSIRIPSSCCGIFGLKPTRGRTPVGPLVSELWGGLAQEHVLSRSVRDSAAMLDATLGRDSAAPYASPPPPKTSYLQTCGEDPKPLRIAVHWNPPMPCPEVHSDCVAAVRDAAQLCEALGHTVVEVDPQHPSSDLGRWFLIVIGANIAANIAAGEQTRGRKATRDDYELTTRVSALVGASHSAGDFVSATWGLQAEMRRMVERFAEFDVVLTPTLGRPPLEVGALDPSLRDAVVQRIALAGNLKALFRNKTVLQEAARDVFSFAPFTPLANFCGVPSMSVPLWWNQDAMPIGAMFTAAFGREDILFALAGQLERARPWIDKRPPVHAAT